MEQQDFGGMNRRLYVSEVNAAPNLQIVISQSAPVPVAMSQLTDRD